MTIKIPTRDELRTAGARCLTSTATISELLGATSALVKVMDRGLAHEGPWTQLTCVEAEALAAVLRAAPAMTHPDVASTLLAAHALGDDEDDDLHHDAYLAALASGVTL